MIHHKLNNKKKILEGICQHVLSLGGEIMVIFSLFFAHFPNFLNDQNAESMLNGFILNTIICNSHCRVNFCLNYKTGVEDTGLAK